MRKWIASFGWSGSQELLSNGEAAQGTFVRTMDETGGAIVEMAVSCAVLFAMFFAVFELSLASYTYNYVSEAAREGARYAIVRGSESCTNTPNLSNCNASPATIGNHVKSLAYPGINSAANMTVATTYLTSTTTGGSSGTSTTWAACAAGTCNAPRNMVNVSVTYAYPLSIPFVPQRTLNLSSTSQMVVQQ
jgi:Flp pilus assembly protein TadG